MAKTGLSAKLRDLSECLWWDMGYEENHTHKDDRALLGEAAAALDAGICANCHSDVWNPGEGWLVRKDGVVTVCRSAWHPENERNLPPVERLPRLQKEES